MTGSNDAKRADVLWYQFLTIRGGLAPYDNPKLAALSDREKFRIAFRDVMAMTDQQIEEKHHAHR